MACPPGETPRPYLDRACAAPATATAAGRFIDTDDLVAARRACLQSLAVIDSGLSEVVAGFDCDTPWRITSADRPHLIEVEGTDLGLGGPRPDLRRQEVVDQLWRMDPSPGMCGEGWASGWRNDVPARWRAGQAAMACIDGT